MVHDTVKVMLLTEIVLYYLSYTAGTGLTDVVEKTTVFFCWHVLHKGHKLVCCQFRGGFYQAFNRTLRATQRNVARVGEWTGSRYRDKWAFPFNIRTPRLGNSGILQG